VATDTKESAYKKKPPVSFLVQHPHQIPLPANDKNSFRSSLFLPSHTNLEEEYFNEVIAGFKQVIQGHLVSSATAEKRSFIYVV
jgi:dTDP-4-amino-4,6-dideoxygalactose transaminase